MKTTPATMYPIDDADHSFDQRIDLRELPCLLGLLYDPVLEGHPRDTSQLEEMIDRICRRLSTET